MCQSNLITVITLCSSFILNNYCSGNENYSPLDGIQEGVITSVDDDLPLPGYDYPPNASPSLPQPPLPTDVDQQHSAKGAVLLELNGIQDILKGGCLVAMIESGPLKVSGTLRNALEEIRLRNEGFRQLIPVAHIDGSLIAGVGQQSVSFDVRPPGAAVDGTVAVLAKSSVDRTCLYKPHTLHKVIKLHIYTGPEEPWSLLEFINQHCRSYWSFPPFGNVDIDQFETKQGQQRRTILANLYSTAKHISRPVTLKQLADRCSDLRSFFYHGFCPVGNYSSVELLDSHWSNSMTKEILDSDRFNSSSGATCNLSSYLKIAGEAGFVAETNTEDMENICLINDQKTEDYLVEERKFPDISLPIDGKEFNFDTAKDFVSTEENLVIPKCDVINMDFEDGGHSVDLNSLQTRFLKYYLFPNKPVILRGAANKWPAKEKWTNDFFRKHYNSTKIHIKISSLGEFEGIESIDRWLDLKNLKHHVPQEVIDQLTTSNHVMVRPAGVEMTFGEFLALVEGSDAGPMGVSDTNSSNRPTRHWTPYLEYSPIKERLFDLNSDLPPPPFLPNLLDLHLLNIWFSDGNTLGKLHFDEFDNLLVQLSGQKQVMLFEPRNNVDFREGHILEAGLKFRNGALERGGLLETTSMTMAPVDIFQPNFKEFPALSDVLPINCTIQPGDVLYLPAFWWHEVQSYPDAEEQRNLAVNYWYDPFFTKEFPCAECPMDVNYKYRHLMEM